MKTKSLIVLGLSMFLLFSPSSIGKTEAIEWTDAEKAFIKDHAEIRMGVDPQFIPFEFVDSDGQHKGIAADFVELLEKKIGIHLVMAPNLTWDETYEKAVEKEIDVLSCVSKTIDRQKYFLFSDSYYSFQRVIIVKDSNETITEFEDLRSQTVAVQKDSSHHSYLKDYPTINLSLYPTVEEALAAVVIEHEIAYVGNLAASSYLIKANGFTNLKLIEIDAQDKQSLYFAVREDWPELVSILNKGLASITKEEKIEINNRWIGVEKNLDYGPIIRIIVMISTIFLAIVLVSLYWIVKLKREVSKRVQVQEALNLAKEEAELANHIKSSFLARMSHEIRTPLNAITGMAYLIKKTDVTTTQKIYLEKITHASRNMLGIINDILDFSKIEAGKVTLERISFNLEKVMQQVISTISFGIEEQGIEFGFNRDPQLPAHYFGDPTRIEQILLNVISNAVKFTSKGEVTASIRLIASEGERYQIEFSIKDTGIGMSKEQLDQLFMPFDQADASINRRFGGTGLGLSIVKSLVEMMGGVIQVWSTVGVGSTFNIQLPLEVDRKKEFEYKQQSSTIFTNIRVLVLDKNLSYLRLLEDYLYAFGIKSEVTTDEISALQLLRANPIELFILDYDTPTGGSIAFVEQIKSDESIVMKPKFIVMIPLMREDLFQEIEAYKIDLGITKPIMPSVLYNGIIEIFKAKVLDTHEVSSQARMSDQIVLDYPYHVLIVEDNRTNQFIAKSILEQAGFRVSLTEHGQDGYDFFVAHQQEIDLILMDLHMPVLNGYEASRLIRVMNSVIPIIAMTADAITGVQEKCKDVGINHYISKPFEPEQFVDTLLGVINQLKQEKGLNPMQMDSPSSTMEEADLLDETDGLRRLGQNKEVYEMVLAEYVRENEDVVVELSKAIEEKNHDAAIQIVHKNKSSSGNIGAKQLFQVASELQKALSIPDEKEIQRIKPVFDAMLTQLLVVIHHRLAQNTTL